jgi:hypothetical protein
MPGNMKSSNPQSASGRGAFDCYAHALAFKVALIMTLLFIGWYWLITSKVISNL